jgi:hypothetical protein
VHRIDQAVAMWAAIDSLSERHGLPDRAGLALYEAALGYRVRRSTYLKRAGVEERTASRDLKQLADGAFLRAVGATRGRHYVAGPAVASVLEARQVARARMRDPYPWLPSRLAEPTPLEQAQSART